MRLPALMCVALAFALSAGALAAGTPYCAGGGPESVLRCYSDAYAARDSVAFARLIAPDYVSTDVDDPNVAPFDSVGALRVAGRIFHAPEITGLKLEFGAPDTLMAGAQPGTWLLSDVPCTLTVSGAVIAGQTGPWSVKQVVRLWVRQVEKPGPHFVIFHEELRRSKAQ